MICKNCGANMGTDATECPYCGTTYSTAEGTQQMESKIAVTGQQMESLDIVNPLIGKEYSFSGNDLVIKGRWGVRFNISVGEDRLHFETVPAKKNLLPAVMLEDILAIEESFHMRTANILLGILGLLLGLSGGYWGFILPIFVFLCYRERKMKIYIRNGKVLTIYSDDKESVNQFIEDMKTITKIKK